jgi:hypothetical protein
MVGRDRRRPSPRPRRDYRAAGWTLCPHDTCPPWDCQATYADRLPLTLDDPLARWEWHGAAAHAAGCSAPILDEAVFFALATANPPVGDPRTLPRLDAWTRGWVTASLAEPEVTG